MMFYLSIPVESNYLLVITDITGKTVYSNTNYHNNDGVKVAAFSKGIYLLRARTREQSFTGKVILN
jgi:hypothetical protein